MNNLKTTPDTTLRPRAGLRHALLLAILATLPPAFAHAEGAPATTASAATGNSGAPLNIAPSGGANASSAPSGQSETSGTASGASATNPPLEDSRALSFDRAALIRRLIPSRMLEEQATAEFNEIVRGAAHSDRLYPPTDPHVQRVEALVDRLEPYALKWSDRVKRWKWEVAVIRSPDIRMYCLPGGKIIVYGGLLDRVKLNDNELGMLFGHEIAHAVREHVRERLGEQQQAQLQQGAVPQLFGLADLGVFPLGIGSQLFEMHYGRADEAEADVIGSDIASRAGFDPRAAVTLWDKLAAATRSDHDDGYIYVHPYSPARREDIVKRLPDMLSLYAKAIGTPLSALPDYEGMGVPQRRQPTEQQR
ncbi:MAG TPA: M48 family metallopeptidase [Paraburkholderia sp.]